MKLIEILQGFYELVGKKCTHFIPFKTGMFNVINSSK